LRRYKTVDVSEARLEDLVRQAPDLLETGLRFVDHQRPTREGRLDILLVDSGRALVVAELKVVEDDGVLLQALDYYDYVQDNLEALARTFSTYDIDAQQTPRLFLLAPSFSVTLLNRIKWLSIAPSVSLFTYRCIVFEEPEGEPVPVYTEVKAPALREAVVAFTEESHLNYVTDATVRGKAEGVLAAIRALGPGVSIDPVKSGLSIKLNGRVFAYGWPKRRYVTFGYFGSDDQWTYEPIEAETDPEPLKASLYAAYARRKSGS